MNILHRIIAYFYGKMRGLYYQRRYEFYHKEYKLENKFGFNGTDIRIYGNGRFLVGLNSYIGSNSTIQCNENNKVVIGDNCQISHNVRLYTLSDNPDQDFNLDSERTKKAGDIIIGNGVWIGANVLINPGIIVGNNSVIGANSVVTKNIEDNSIYGGVPAKLIRLKRSAPNEIKPNKYK